MRVGIVGPGNVGTTLGARLARKHTVKFGSRDPSQRPDLGAAVAPVPDVCEWAEVVILAVPGFRTAGAAQTISRGCGPGVAGGARGARR